MKRICKRIADLIATLIVLPAYLFFCWNRRLLGPSRAIAGASQLFSLLPGLGGVFLRRAFYRLVLPECGVDGWIGFGTVFSHQDNRLGHNVYIGLYCTVGEVTIEDDVLIGSHVSIMNGSGQHGTDRLDVPIREQPGRWPRVTIGRDSWIGDRAVVMADVGRHCIVGAGSVVTRPLSDYSVAVGVPARVVRVRTDVARNNDRADRGVCRATA
jgi:acetyltransferase-like isoleucine patch superfamily enzyme